MAGRRAADLPAIRAELAEQMRREHDGERNTLVIKPLVVVLFAARKPRCAREARFRAGISVDVHLRCGAGSEATRRDLRGANTVDALTALACVLEREACGDFAGHDAADGRRAGAWPRVAGATACCPPTTPSSTSIRISITDKGASLDSIDERNT